MFESYLRRNVTHYFTMLVPFVLDQGVTLSLMGATRKNLRRNVTLFGPGVTLSLMSNNFFLTRNVTHIVRLFAFQFGLRRYVVTERCHIENSFSYWLKINQ